MRELVLAGRLAGRTSCRSSPPRTPRPAPCRGSCATKSITSVDSQPFSSCAMMSAAHHRRLLLVGRILRRSRGRSSSGNRSRASASPVDLPEDDVLRADDRHRVGEHVAARHLVERGEVREARRRGSSGGRACSRRRRRGRCRTRPWDARPRRRPRLRGTCMPSVKSLKWWISSSMLLFISTREGGATLWLSVITGPGFVRSQSMHCRTMRFDWRISSMRTR